MTMRGYPSSARRDQSYIPKKSVTFGDTQAIFIKDDEPLLKEKVTPDEIKLMSLLLDALESNEVKNILKNGLPITSEYTGEINRLFKLIDDFKKYFPDNPLIRKYQIQAAELIIGEGDTKKQLCLMCNEIYEYLNKKLSEDNKIIGSLQKEIFKKINGNKSETPVSKHDFDDLYKNIFTETFLSKLLTKLAEKYPNDLPSTILIKRLNKSEPGAVNVVREPLSRMDTTSDEHPSQQAISSQAQRQLLGTTAEEDRERLRQAQQLRQIMKSSLQPLNEIPIRRQARVFEDDDIDRVISQMKTVEGSEKSIIQSLVAIQHIELDDNGQLRFNFKHIRDFLNNLTAEPINELDALEKCLNENNSDETQVNKLVKLLGQQIDHKLQKYHDTFKVSAQNPFNNFFKNIKPLKKAIQSSNKYMETLKTELNNDFTNLSNLSYNENFDPVKCFNALKNLIKNGIYFDEKDREPIDTHIKKFKEWMTHAEEKFASFDDQQRIITGLLEDISKMLLVRLPHGTYKKKTVDELLFNNVLRETHEKLTRRLNKIHMDTLKKYSQTGELPNPKLFFQALGKAIQLKGLTEPEKTIIYNYKKKFENWIKNTMNSPPTQEDQKNTLFIDLLEMVNHTEDVFGQIINLDEKLFNGGLKSLLAQINPKIISL